MKKPFTKAIAALLAAAMLVPAGAAASAQSEPSASDSNYCKGVFYYRPGEGEIAALSDSIDYYTYSDDYFRGSGRVYNDHLATLSMCLAAASVSSTREPFTTEGYTRKNRDVIAFLEDTGFSDIAINKDYTLKPAKDTIGCACAHKQITDGGKTYTMLTIVPRSAGYEMEWGNNFVLGAEGDAAGFDGSAEKCLEFTRDYITKTGISGDIKVWAAGYSRGAAIVNLIGKRLIDDPRAALGEAVEATPDNLYIYNFGTPMAADSANDPRNERYAGIFNAYDDAELASSMAPPAMNFERYGTDRILKIPERKEEMLANLKTCNPVIYEEFTTSTSSYFFSPKKIGLADGSIAMVNDDDSYIPDNAADYLRGLADYLTQISGNRRGYAEKYEQAFSDFIGYFRSLNGEDSSAFGSAFLGNDETYDMALAMYAYFMKEKYEIENSATQQQLEAVAAQIKTIIDKARSENGTENEDSELVGAPDATKIAQLAIDFAKYLFMDSEEIKPIAAKHLGVVLEDAMVSSHADQEILGRLTTPEALDALTYVLSHLFFGNKWQSSQVRPFLINNEQMKNAATLASNITCLMYDHANEVIISWLRLYDSYFAEYTALTDAQIAGYRRVYLRSETPEDVNGVILDGSGNTAAVVKNGVMFENTDKWVGYTSTDDGGFFRVPLDGDYTVRLDGFTGTIGAKVGEYSCYSAETATVFEQSASAEKSSTVTLTLPALSEGYEMPSAAEYKLTVSADGEKEYLMGDVDLDGVINITDITLIQLRAADMTVFSELQDALADVTGDGKVTVDDATAVQYFTAEFAENTGKTGEKYIA